MGDLRLNSKSVSITAGVICLMTTMYFTGQWVGQQTSRDTESGNQISLNAEELSMLRKNEFLEVSKILNDPKTTNYPLPVNYNQHPEYQGIQSEMKRPPYTNKSDINPNKFKNEEVASVKPLRTKDIFVNQWVRDLGSTDICQ